MQENNLMYQARPSIALLLPSYGRLADLQNVLANTPLGSNMRFIVSANYEPHELELITSKYGDLAHVIDERIYGRGSMVKAYNLAYFYAREMQFDYVALWADDLMPQEEDWYVSLRKLLVEDNVDFGIFSSDECHKGVFGWNFFDEIPNAHFFLARPSVLGEFFLNPSLNAYVSDYEVCVRMVAKHIRMHLLPIRLNHYPTENETRSKNMQFYLQDTLIFNAMHPHLRGRMDNVVLKGDYRTTGRFVRDDGKLRSSDFYKADFISYDDLVGTYQQISRMSSEQALGLAMRHHQAGQLDQAETLYNKALVDDQNNFAALHMLGVVTFQRGDLALAEQFLLRAVAINVLTPEVHYNLGNVYAAQGRSSEARACYSQALALNNDFALALQQLTLLDDFTKSNIHSSQ